jgi:pilus assembly protein CpaE
MALRILIADSNPTTSEQIRADLASDNEIEIAGMARDGQEALLLAHHLRPDIALVSIDLAVYNGFQTVEFLVAAESLPTVSILLSNSESPELMHRAMRVGAREYLTYPISRERLVQTIHEVHAEIQRRQSAQFTEAADPTRSARIIVVGGAKGGIGKTTVTANLAIALAQETGEPTALVDLYTQFGDISLLMNITPRRTLMDMADMAPEALDTQILEDCMEPHESGVRVLVTSRTPVALDAISITFLDRILRLLKDRYRYILIDLPPILHGGTLHAFSYATSVLLLANRNEITTINDTRMLLDTLEGKYVARENIHVVMNRLSDEDRMESSDIEQALNCSIAGHIPNDIPVVSESINQGVPFMLSHPSSAVANGIRQLAYQMMGRSVETEDTTVVNLPARRWGGLLSGLIERGQNMKRKQAA